MNIQDANVLIDIRNNKYCTQRAISERTGYSLGSVNNSVNELAFEGYIDTKCCITDRGCQAFDNSRPKQAVILAAGFGTRMVPINTNTSKGLLEVHGEPLVERLIIQLHEVGIRDIYIVVGYLKEQYEYLIDEYGVSLIVNNDYILKNNLHSLKCAVNHLENSYIIPCDIWFRDNPFRKEELYSWYLLSEEESEAGNTRINRKMEIVKSTNRDMGNVMVGLAYLTEVDAQFIRRKVVEACDNKVFDNSFWEDILFDREKFYLHARVIHRDDFVEINTYEQLRELDNNSNQLKTDALEIVASVLNVSENEIKNIFVSKKGMTNRSFLFNVGEKRYIMRIPGEGTEKLINRKQEAVVYETISKSGFGEKVLYLNPTNGYKLTEYIEGARNCNTQNYEDIKKCMNILRRFHESNFAVEHIFDIFKQIDFYESLWGERKSVFRDYEKTKSNVFSLIPYIETHMKPYVLTHIDAVPDNFLFSKNGITIIDWEYAGMQDPDVDIAMFCIYSMYEKEEVDRLIDCYYPEGTDEQNRYKIYCYIACCGLLWSNWCEYKRSLGIEFGDYALRQYRYAKEYYRIFAERFGDIENE